MYKKSLILKYSISHLERKNIHSAGPELCFNSPCIGYVKKGYAKFLYKGQTIYAYEGDLIYIARGTKYHSIWFGSPDIEFYSVDFDFKSQYDFYEYQFQILKNYPSELLDKMFDSYESSYLLSVSYFYQLLNDVYNKLKAVFTYQPHTTIKPAIEYIESNYNHNIPIRTLAGLCHCSESGFFKLFKKSTGVTPITYKQNIMIQNALDLLSNTNLSIEEISTLTGFSSSNYFRTVFLKLTGKTPKALRIKNS